MNSFSAHVVMIDSIQYREPKDYRCTQKHPNIGIVYKLQNMSTAIIFIAAKRCTSP